MTSLRKVMAQKGLFFYYNYDELEMISKKEVQIYRKVLSNLCLDGVIGTIQTIRIADFGP